LAEFAPAKTIVDFKQLDDGEMLEGYLDGFHGSSEPGSDRGPSGMDGAMVGSTQGSLNRMARNKHWRRSFARSGGRPDNVAQVGWVSRLHGFLGLAAAPVSLHLRSRLARALDDLH
jgi:hypothetical protein